MYRRNPLVDPIGILSQIVRDYDRNIEERQREFRNWLSDFYDRGEVRVLRYAVEKLGNLAAYQDMQEYAQEMLDTAREYPDELENLMLAMYDRVMNMLESPPYGFLRKRFEQLQRQESVDFEGIKFEFQTTYIDHFPDPFDTFVFNYLHGGLTLTGLLWTIEKLVAMHRSPDNYDYLAEEFVNLRHREMADTISDKDLANVLEHINGIITGRTSYGRRRETMDSPDFTKLIWSNGSAAWYISSGTEERATVQKYFHNRQPDFGFLDANIIVVPYPPAVVELILTSLYPLPLYQYSTEAKHRARLAGKQGPLVSDREAKRIVKSIALKMVQDYWVENYGVPKDEVDIDEQNWQVKAAYKRIWEDLVKAKRSYDKDAFMEVLAEHKVSHPSFLGRLVHWFGGLEL